jgi:hypothetical protein
MNQPISYFFRYLESFFFFFLPPYICLSGAASRLFKWSISHSHLALALDVLRGSRALTPLISLLALSINTRM